MVLVSILVYTGKEVMFFTIISYTPCYGVLSIHITDFSEIKKTRKEYVSNNS